MNLAVFGKLLKPFEFLAKPLTDYLSHRQEIKKIERQGEVDVKKAQVEGQVQLAKDGQILNAEWENKALDNSGWKDEWFSLLLSIPSVLAFIPSYVPYVQAGFAVLATMPEWYIAAFLTAVFASFGRKVVLPALQSFRSKKAGEDATPAA